MTNSFPMSNGRPASPEVNQSVVILGTGDFSRALASRLVANGYAVTMGSRRPERRNIAIRSPHLSEVNVVGIEEALGMSDLVFLALPSNVVVDTLLALKSFLVGKILIDVSNPDDVSIAGSTTAEVLQETFPQASVIKGFNTISAHAMESRQSMGSTVVYLASDCPRALDRVSSVARDLGLQYKITGGLKTSGSLEELHMEMWSGWGIPLLLALAVWMMWTIYGTWRYHFYKTHAASRWPVNTNNKIAASTAITLLATCYLPGSIAAVVQLKNGTKHMAFPRWLDQWLKMRKQLGLLALASACFHCVLSLATISPAYFKKWYDFRSITIPGNNTADFSFPIDSRMNWIGEVTIYLGSISLVLLCAQGVASLPSVTERLSWKRWWMLQSVIGHIALLFAIAHAAAKVLPFIFDQPFSTLAQGMSFLSNLLPSFTLLFRMFLFFPCVGIPLQKIRRGWERGIDDLDDEDEEGVGIPLDGAVCKMEDV